VRKKEKQFLYCLTDFFDVEKNILNKINEGIIICDNLGKIIFVNTAIQSLIGYTVYDLEGENIQKIFQNNNFKEDLLQYLKSPDNNDFEKSFEYWGKDNSAKFLHLRIFSYENEGKNNFFVVINEKIRTPKIDEIEGDYKELLTNFQSFISIIGHDVRNVFAQIMSLSGIMIDDFEDLSDENIKQYLEMIKNSTGKGLLLIDNILKWGRLISKRDSVILMKYKLNDIILNVINSKEELLISKNIKINYEEKDISVNTDYNLLIQAISNILDNAIKFSNPNTVIDIKTSFDLNNVEIIIEDQGKGMSSEALENIFVKPFRYIQIGTYGEVGNGIGMLLVREFIKKIRGEIKIESKKNIGTKVKIKIPLAK